MNGSQSGNPTVTLTSDVTEYTWTAVPAGRQYLVSVQYLNDAGPGPSRQSINYLTPYCRPDPPVITSVVPGDGQAVVSWMAPTFNGQSNVTTYKVYKNGALLATLGDYNLRSYTATGLINGVSYDFQLVAFNAKGDSLMSDVASVSPYTQMSIVSVVASGKTLTVTFNPAGYPIESVTILAIDQDLSSDEFSSLMVTIPQNEISQSASSTIQVIKTFAGFSSNIAYWAVMASNAVSTASQQASSLASA